MHSCVDKELEQGIEIVKIMHKENDDYYQRRGK